MAELTSRAASRDPVRSASGATDVPAQFPRRIITQWPPLPLRTWSRILSGGPRPGARLERVQPPGRLWASRPFDLEESPAVFGLW